MSITYSYDEPVGGATLMQVTYFSGEKSKAIELDAVFVDGVFDSDATEAVVAAEVDNILAQFIDEGSLIVTIGDSA